MKTKGDTIFLLLFISIIFSSLFGYTRVIFTISVCLSVYIVTKAPKKINTLTYAPYLEQWILIIYTSIISIYWFLIDKDYANTYFQGYITYFLGIYTMVLIIVSICLCNVRFDVILSKFRNLGVFVSCFGLYEIYTHQFILKSIVKTSSTAANFGILYVEIYHRIVTFFGHPIIFGVFLTFIWIILLYYPYEKKLIDWIAKILVLINIIGTQSRSSYISVAIITVIWLAMNRGKNIKKVLNLKNICCAFIVIVIICSILALNEKWGSDLNVYLQSLYIRWTAGISSTTDSGSDMIRLIIMNKALEFLGQRENLGTLLFGHGYGYGGYFLNKYNVITWTDWYAMDNQYLTCIFETGLISIFLHLSIIFRALKAALDKNSERWVRVGGFSLCSIYITAYFFESFSWSVVLFIYFLSLVMVASARKKEKKENKL